MREIDSLPRSILWITLINYGYVEFARNFLASMRSSHSQFTLLVFCTDTQAAEALSEYKNCICIDADVFLKFRLTRNLSTWGKSEYRKLSFAKLDAVSYAMTHSYKLGFETVAFIDTDIVLFSDPSPILRELMNEHKNVDIFSQCDESAEACSNPSACPLLCTGLMAFRNISSNHKLFSYTESDVKNYTSDQDFLNKSIADQKTRTLTVGKNIFLNGSHPYLRNPQSLARPSSACAAHFNYMIGFDKIHRMKELSLWNP